MKKIVSLFMLFLIPLVSACGPEHEEEYVSGGITGLSILGMGSMGLFGLIIQVLVIITLGLLIGFIIKKLK